MNFKMALLPQPGMTLASLFALEIAVETGEVARIIDIKRADTAAQCRKDFQEMVATCKNAKVKPHAITLAAVGMKSATYSTCYNFWWFSKNDRMYLEDSKTKDILRVLLS
jgi:hypothetical protein